MHYKDHRTFKQSNALAKLICKGKTNDIASMAIHHTKHLQDDTHGSLKQALDNSTVTKEIAEILTPLEKGYSCFILIEGPPGIGKSVLLKEIACRWSKKELLQAFKLVILVCLRDPIVQQGKSVDDLLQLYCTGDKRAAEITSACSDYLFDKGGKDLILLLNGFDELPEVLQKNSLIANILKRHMLPCCGLILSSRPHASKDFHKQATVIVEVLGFTEEDRRHCIEQAFQGKPQKIKELSQYLDDHLHINSLCFVPFNMVVLLYLHEQGISLPKNSTDMYNHFICITICRHLSKAGQPLTNFITDLNKLPEPYSRIIKQLSTLSLQAIDQNKLVFTLDEIKAVCPDIEYIPGAINGFGLLQAIQHFGLTAKILTFHFIHLSIQEYLAACCIIKLSPHKELEILQKKFWLVNYRNTFAMYIVLTKGRQPSFKKFLSDGSKKIHICQDFLNNVKLCVHLYHCFHEAGDEELCAIIANAKIFNDKIIYSHANLPSDVTCMALFLATSLHRTWSKLEFDHIQDYGFHILYRSLHSSGITITELWLWHCDLTSSSSMFVSDITISCRVKRLIIDDNETIGENEQLYSM